MREINREAEVNVEKAIKKYGTKQDLVKFEALKRKKKAFIIKEYPDGTKKSIASPETHEIVKPLVESVIKELTVNIGAMLTPDEAK